MAERPVFIPNLNGSRLVSNMSIEFKWHPGMAPSQKRKNVSELHEAARLFGISRLLEVSSKSELEVGRKLSAFYQKVLTSDGIVPLECAYQGSKVFQNGGPFTDLFCVEPKEAKRDKRLLESGKLIGFNFQGSDYPLSPPNGFYDWLYMNAIYPHRDWLSRLLKIDGFTDIEFNPTKSINCQARACALFVSLEKRGLLDKAMTSYDDFSNIALKGLI